MIWLIFFEKLLPSFPWKVESSKTFKKKNKNFQSSKKAENRYQKYPNVFWTYFGVNFSKKFCPVSHGRSSVRKFSKKTKNFQSSKKPKIVTKSVQTCFEHVSGKLFKKFFAQCSMQARDFENFHKNQKIFKIPKIAKIISKRIQMCFERACFAENFSNKNFCPVFHGVSRLLNFEKSRKNLKFTNMPKIDTKIVQMCFEHVLGRYFWNFFAQFSMEGRVFENFQKN